MTRFSCDCGGKVSKKEAIGRFFSYGEFGMVKLTKPLQVLTCDRCGEYYEAANDSSLQKALRESFEDNIRELIELIKSRHGIQEKQIAYLCGRQSLGKSLRSSEFLLLKGLVRGGKAFMKSMLDEGWDHPEESAKLVKKKAWLEEAREGGPWTQLENIAGDWFFKGRKLRVFQNFYFFSTSALSASEWIEFYELTMEAMTEARNLCLASEKEAYKKWCHEWEPLRVSEEDLDEFLKKNSSLMDKLEKIELSQKDWNLLEGELEKPSEPTESLRKLMNRVDLESIAERIISDENQEKWESGELGDSEEHATISKKPSK